MSNIKTEKLYNLEDRTLEFAKNVRRFVNKLPKSAITLEDSTQLIRSSGSVDANYIEANESLSKKDFQMRIRISRKESKESRYWLQVIEDSLTDGLKLECDSLIQESTELMKILSSILNKSLESI